MASDKVIVMKGRHSEYLISALDLKIMLLSYRLSSLGK